MDAWWPLIRRSGDSGWAKLKGVTRDCLWQRIAAEVLLRTHEELAERGILECLPDLTASTWRDALHSRITPRERDAETLNRTLAKFGLSPHPRVLLLLEGQSEMIQVAELLKELGLDRPDRVHLQNCHSSKINPQLISRYAIAPRLGSLRGERQLLDRPPTALVVAMDPENRWRDAAAREDARRQLQQAIREEVAWQGGTINQQDLDFLVNIHVWGEDTYELANFSDDELVFALTQLATEQSLDAVALPSWETDLRAALQRARAVHCDFQREVGKLRVREDKPRLAEILMPTLLARYQAELAADELTTPVLRVIQEVQRLVARLSGGSYMLSRASDPT